MNKRHTWFAVIPFILFVMLAIFIMAGMTVHFEGWAYNESIDHMSPILTTVVKVITHIGDSVVVILLCFLLIVIPTTRKVIALPVSISVIISSILNGTLKISLRESVLIFYD